MSIYIQMSWRLFITLPPKAKKTRLLKMGNLKSRLPCELKKVQYSNVWDCKVQDSKVWDSSSRLKGLGLKGPPTTKPMGS